MPRLGFRKAICEAKDQEGRTTENSENLQQTLINLLISYHNHITQNSKEIRQKTDKSNQLPI